MRAGCRIVTRLKTNTPFTVIEERPVAAGVVDAERSHRTICRNRLPHPAEIRWRDSVREVRVMIETGKVLRIFTNDLTASAQEIADLYKRAGPSSCSFAGSSRP